MHHGIDIKYNNMVGQRYDNHVAMSVRVNGV